MKPLKRTGLETRGYRWLALLSLTVLASCGGSLNDTSPGAVNESLVFSAELNGSQETPPNTSPGAGIGLAIVNARTLNFSASVVSTGVADTVAHIHQAPPGVAGPVVFPLTKEAGRSVWNVQGTLTPAQVATMRAGGFYFNVHSATFPEGEIRGQINFRLPSREQLDRLLQVAQQSQALQALVQQVREQAPSQ